MPKYHGFIVNCQINETITLIGIIFTLMGIRVHAFIATFVAEKVPGFEVSWSTGAKTF